MLRSLPAISNELSLLLPESLLAVQRLNSSFILDIFNVTNQNQAVDVDDNKFNQAFDDPNQDFED